MLLAFNSTRIVNAQESAELLAHWYVAIFLFTSVIHGELCSGQLPIFGFGVNLNRYVSLVILRQLRYQKLWNFHERYIALVSKCMHKIFSNHWVLYIKHRKNYLNSWTCWESRNFQIFAPPISIYTHKLDLWPWPWPSLWPLKVTGSLDVNVTYFMTPRVNLTFDLDLRVKHLTWQVTTDA